MNIKVAVLSTYPPTECGIATFARSLIENLQPLNVQVGVISLNPTSKFFQSPVAYHLNTFDPKSLKEAAKVINQHDILLIQHEYGIYPGLDGCELLLLLHEIDIPIVTVTHTVLSNPTTGQFDVLHNLAAHSELLIAMTQTGQRRLVNLWDIPENKVRVISHGAPDLNHLPQTHKRTETLNLLTWGLLGPGKGIEWSLRALAALPKDTPKWTYTVAGQTHPKVLAKFGESYRLGLKDLAVQLGISNQVIFDNRYLTPQDLGDIIQNCDLVVLPYDSLEQVTSGVLVEAVAAGKPVIATMFPHAAELLESGAGILVPQQNTSALRDALLRLLTDTNALGEMAGVSRALSTSLLWPAVANEYKDTLNHVLEETFQKDLLPWVLA